MPERQTDESQTDGKKIPSRLNKLYIGGLLGGTSGLLSYGVSSLITNQDMAHRIGVGVGGALVTVGAGAGLSSLSMERAEDYLEQGKNIRARIEMARATLEGAIGLGGAAAIVGLESDGLTRAVVAGGIGAFWGGLGTYLIYRERVKPFPELILPDGSSVERDLSFPSKQDGLKYPPVFRASSLEDLLKFREANKDRIVRWAGTIPSESDDPHSLTALNLVTSVFIVSDLGHYPALDPENSLDVKILGKNTGDDITAHPCRDSFLVWPYQTNFESMFANNRVFDRKKWLSWKEQSWHHEAILLAQYQDKGTFGTANPDTTSDNYWLLDIGSHEDGSQRRVTRNLPQAAPSLVAHPIHF